VFALSTTESRYIAARHAGKPKDWKAVGEQILGISKAQRADGIMQTVKLDIDYVKRPQSKK